MKNSEKKIQFIDLRDAAENLALSQHLLVRELLKLEIKIWVRFDEISSRMVKIIPPKDNQKYIDYRINPDDIHCLSMDSSKRIERMLEKSELVFQGLRLEIDFGGYPLTLQIVEDDPGMHLVVNKKDLDLISKLPICSDEFTCFVLLDTSNAAKRPQIRQAARNLANLDAVGSQFKWAPSHTNPVILPIGSRVTKVAPFPPIKRNFSKFPGGLLHDGLQEE